MLGRVLYTCSSTVSTLGRSKQLPPSQFTHLISPVMQASKGTVLYRVLWRGYPPDVATWEKAHDDWGLGR
eukprot:scaffold208405_cov31-Tisochrysis_lutea.AAC.1